MDYALSLVWDCVLLVKLNGRTKNEFSWCSKHINPYLRHALCSLAVLMCAGWFVGC